MPITTAGCMDLICVSAADVWTKWTPGQIQANNCTMSFFFLSTFTLFFSLSLSVFLDLLMLFVSDTLACDPCTAGMVRETSQGFYLDGLFVTIFELREYIVDDPLSYT